ncbi:MAG: ribosomal protein S18-alanine N-acetyltransferase [Proteobacteria bacterium]|jgi:ribosomal-protein-alanine N-acetyltransferase|nr:ribosomal protein S18-alanine N-acetyltransferase [Pseudomonadota bacterium]
MNIRLIKKGDISILAKLDKLSNLTFWNQGEYLSSFNNPRHMVYVLETGANEIVAAIVLSIVTDEAEILQFWVKQDCKRQGYGKVLLEYMLNILKMKHVLHIFLEVRDGNTPAINLYRTLGFQIVGKRCNYYTVDSWQYDALTMML